MTAMINCNGDSMINSLKKLLMNSLIHSVLVTMPHISHDEDNRHCGWWDVAEFEADCKGKDRVDKLDNQHPRIEFCRGSCKSCLNPTSTQWDTAAPNTLLPCCYWCCLKLSLLSDIVLIFVESCFVLFLHFNHVENAVIVQTQQSSDQQVCTPRVLILVCFVQPQETLPDIKTEFYHSHSAIVL